MTCQVSCRWETVFCWLLEKVIYIRQLLKVVAFNCDQRGVDCVLETVFYFEKIFGENVFLLCLQMQLTEFPRLGNSEVLVPAASIGKVWSHIVNTQVPFSIDTL